MSTNTLVQRLRGQYEVGDNREFDNRDFSKFIPAISLEAADRIEELELALKDLLNDCINFGTDDLTNFILERATKVINKGEL